MFDVLGYLIFKSDLLPQTSAIFRIFTLILTTLQVVPLFMDPVSSKASRG